MSTGYKTKASGSCIDDDEDWVEVNCDEVGGKEPEEVQYVLITLRKSAQACVRRNHYGSTLRRKYGRLLAAAWLSPRSCASPCVRWGVPVTWLARALHFAAFGRASQCSAKSLSGKETAHATIRTHYHSTLIPLYRGLVTYIRSQYTSAPHPTRASTANLLLPNSLSLP